MHEISFEVKEWKNKIKICPNDIEDTYTLENKERR